VTRHDNAIIRKYADKHGIATPEIVADAYGLSLAEVKRWDTQALNIFHRQAISLGLIDTESETGDDAEIFPF
jgi:hypothetical protein